MENKKSKVSIRRCQSYERNRVKRSVREAVDLIGGISNFVKKGQKVLIKPNLLSAKFPDDIVHTHPEVVRAVVALVKEVGGIPVIADSPGAFFTVKSVDMIYSNSGMKEVAEQEGIELVRLDKVTHIQGYPIASFAKECDVIISVPKLKTHNLAIITGAIKNMYGLMPGLYKVQCHKHAPHLQEFSKTLVDIFSIVKPDLSIMDGIIGMEGNGPGSAGLAKNIGLVLASEDAVSLDSIFSEIIGLNPSRNLVIKEAQLRNLGNSRLENIEILGEQLEAVKLSDFKLADASLVYSIPSFLSRPFVSLLNFKPFIEEKTCKKCSICVKSCPVNAIIINEKISKIDPKICVKCFCCHEVCPYSAISIKKSILAKLLWR